MKEKLKNFMQDIKMRKTEAIAIVLVLASAVIATGVLAFSSKDTSDPANITAIDPVNASNISVDNSIVAVAGEDKSSALGGKAISNSWPGEIISLNNLQVQPDREGTISEWYVRIGEQVRPGQVIGKLSRPPQTPDAIMALSERFQMLSEARTSAEALRVYTEKRILQLRQLRADTENSNKQKIDLLGTNTPARLDSLSASIALKKKSAQAILYGSILKVYPTISYQAIIPDLGLNFNIQLKWMFGAADPNLRNKFSGVLFEALSDLKDAKIVPEKSGLFYFDSAIKLANASILDNEILTESSLDSLKLMLIEDQSEFVSMLGEIKSMELERANIQRESIDSVVEIQRGSIDTLAEVDSMIAELEKELAMSEGDLKAKEAAFAAISGSITSGYSIIAPNGGVVSSIMKKPGEFVGPGMPVATVTAGGSEGVLVRMRIPNNSQKPIVGELLSIVRPGFEKDVQKARLVGVGSSLDTDGSYMADAVFIEATKWPTGASVRILTPVSSSTIMVRHSSIFWNEKGTPMVWAVSEGDRIFAKEIVLGRTVGDSMEVYTGLKNGDRYLLSIVPEIKEDMLLSDLIKIITPKGSDSSNPAKSGGHDSMGGMEM